jgi:hypothetical protein
MYTTDCLLRSTDDWQGHSSGGGEQGSGGSGGESMGFRFMGKPEQRRSDKDSKTSASNADGQPQVSDDREGGRSGGKAAFGTSWPSQSPLALRLSLLPPQGLLSHGGSSHNRSQKIKGGGGGESSEGPSSFVQFLVKRKIGIGCGGVGCCAIGRGGAGGG